jgi:hypothetical protein
MILELTPEQRTDLEQAASTARQTRTWKRYQALLLLADGQSIAQVSTVLTCGQSTIYRWAAIWRDEGVTGLAEGPHRGRAHRLDAAAAGHLQAVLGTIRKPAGTTPPGGPCRCCSARWPPPAGSCMSTPCVAPSSAWDTAGSGRSTCSVAPIRPMTKKRGRE